VSAVRFPTVFLSITGGKEAKIFKEKLTFVNKQIIKKRSFLVSIDVLPKKKVPIGPNL
jgi:hypothetical protein